MVSNSNHGRAIAWAFVDFDDSVDLAQSIRVWPVYAAESRSMKLWSIHEWFLVYKQSGCEISLAVTLSQADSGNERHDPLCYSFWLFVYICLAIGNISHYLLSLISLRLRRLPTVVISHNQTYSVFAHGDICSYCGLQLQIWLNNRCG